jgi:hypothetical protein
LEVNETTASDSVVARINAGRPFLFISVSPGPCELNDGKEASNHHATCFLPVHKNDAGKEGDKLLRLIEERRT